MRRAPVQGDMRLRGRPPGTVAWEVHAQAWENYAIRHGDQSVEVVAERGGFSYGELQCALAGHYNGCSTCTVEHPPIPTWEPR